MELSKEEQEAIETINCLGKCYRKEAEDLDFWGSISISVSEDDYYAIQTLLNLISKLQKENEKLSKVIDEMSNIFLKTYRDWEVNRFIFQHHICSKLQNPKSEEKDCYADVWDEQSCRECIKQYFYRKVNND